LDGEAHAEPAFTIIEGFGSAGATPSSAASYAKTGVI
jgi:hypothetical protein